MRSCSQNDSSTAKKIKINKSRRRSSIQKHHQKAFMPGSQVDKDGFSAQVLMKFCNQA